MYDTLAPDVIIWALEVTALLTEKAAQYTVPENSAALANVVFSVIVLRVALVATVVIIGDLVASEGEARI